MSSYREIDVLDETKPILLVQDTDTRKMYVKKPIPAHNRELYNKLQVFSFSGIPQIHEFCETEEGLFLYEDYISGQTLQTVLDESFNLPEDAAVDIVCQLCDILSPLHRCDPPIIHRDIKPSNILLTPSDHVILIDFDASREFDAGKPEDTVLLGTREYAAPSSTASASRTPALISMHWASCSTRCSPALIQDVNVRKVRSAKSSHAARHCFLSSGMLP